MKSLPIMSPLSTVPRRVIAVSRIVLMKWESSRAAIVKCVSTPSPISSSCSLYQLKTSGLEGTIRSSSSLFVSSAPSARICPSLCEECSNICQCMFSMSIMWFPRACSLSLMRIPSCSQSWSACSLLDHVSSSGPLS